MYHLGTALGPESAAMGPYIGRGSERRHGTLFPAPVPHALRAPFIGALLSSYSSVLDGLRRYSPKGKVSHRDVDSFPVPEKMGNPSVHPSFSTRPIAYVG
ncbi:hypothetical protein SUGI_1226050 [Cryptomeria japonica]|uniref:Uncharacterized protein n=1 Tax=Cryptomeria japonica TaxID=3369 RepID=A0AAD3NP13_CRYJA|nr:hypothetical protein SUGI_1226050 [Cryptomeria japonica]